MFVNIPAVLRPSDPKTYNVTHVEKKVLERSLWGAFELTLETQLLLCFIHQLFLNSKTPTTDDSCQRFVCAYSQPSTSEVLNAFFGEFHQFLSSFNLCSVMNQHPVSTKKVVSVPRVNIMLSNSVSKVNFHA